MSTTYNHINKTENQPAHLKRLPRIRIAQIAMDHIAHGWGVEEMCHQHPYLELEEAREAMDYYSECQGEIDQEIEAEIEGLAMPT